MLYHLRVLGMETKGTLTMLRVSQENQNKTLNYAMFLYPILELAFNIYKTYLHHKKLSNIRGCLNYGDVGNISH